MANTATFQINTPSPDLILRSSDFILLPTPPVLPIISSNPANNISQKTWIRAIRNGRPQYQKIIPADGVFKAVEGTELSWNLIASDPSNKVNQTTDATLSYFWRKNDSPITSLNSLNNFNGVKSVLITSESCTVEASGRYVCEVSNTFGVTETKPLDLLVVRLKTYPKLYTNLLVNGNADSNLDGWTTDADIISTRFTNNGLTLGRSFAYGTIDNWYRFRKEDWETDESLGKQLDEGLFSFTQAGWWTTLPATIQQWKDNGGVDWQQIQPEWMESRWRFSGESLLSSYNQWILFGERPQIVANEDRGDFNAFFPGMQWIDRYNKNESVIGLYNESKTQDSRNQILSYFTRDKIKFAKYGGTQTSAMSQTIDFSELADFVDGNVYGVSHLTSQFFAYIGAGLTRYQIRVFAPTQRGFQTYNWFIATAEDFYERLSTNSNKKIGVPSNSTIEIVPIVDDVTDVEIRYLNSDGAVIDVDNIDGPTAKDIWAIKEKAYFPLTLYPLFEFLVGNGCNIKVFGQTYTTTDALKGLFAETSPFPQRNTGVLDNPAAEPSSITATVIQTVQPPTVQNTFSQTAYTSALRVLGLNDVANQLTIAILLGNISNSQNSLLTTLFDSLPPLNIPTTVSLPSLGSPPSIISRIQDRNALFLLEKFGFVKFNSLYPSFWLVNGVSPSVGTTTGISAGRRNRALTDYGSAAMFGVEKTRIVPKQARSAQIIVRFTHQSEVLYDIDPKLKGWDSETLYLDLFSQDTGNSVRFVDYGNPRCGLTKAKFLLVPNNFEPNEDYPSYKLPPAENTVLGQQKRIMMTDQVNTSIDLELGFTNIDILPDAAAPLVAPNPFINQTREQEFNSSLSNSRSVDLNSTTGLAEEVPDGHGDGHAHDEEIGRG